MGRPLIIPHPLMFSTYAQALVTSANFALYFAHSLLYALTQTMVSGTGRNQGQMEERMTTIIEAGHLLDGTGAPPREHSTS